MLLAVVLIAGCGSDTKKWRLVFAATHALNPDDSGEAFPVVVRVYQLKGQERFQRATFTDLWKKDKEFLEGDLLSRKEVTVHPDSQPVLDLDLEVKQGAAFVGVVALFRKPDVTLWKQVFPADLSALNPLTPKRKLVLDRYTIQMVD